MSTHADRRPEEEPSVSRGCGKFIIGVEVAHGEVNYFTEKALRLAQG